MPYPVEVEEDEVKASGLDLPISHKKAKLICRKINGMKLLKAEFFLNRLMNKKENLQGKHYTKTCKHIKEVLENAKNNAVYKGLAEDKVRIRTISAEKGPTQRRMRRAGLGNRLKRTHIKVVLKRD